MAKPKHFTALDAPEPEKFGPEVPAHDIANLKILRARFALKNNAPLVELCDCLIDILDT